MLVITRLPSESIQISGRIRIIVLGVKGRQVRIGVEAPLSVVVDREEIYLRKQKEARRIAAIRGAKSRNHRSDVRKEVSHDADWD